MNQSPATKGESVWLITEPPSARNNAHARKQTGRKRRVGGRSERGADTIAENMVGRGGEGEEKRGGGDQPANLGTEREKQY